MIWIKKGEKVKSCLTHVNSLGGLAGGSLEPSVSAASSPSRPSEVGSVLEMAAGALWDSSCGLWVCWITKRLVEESCFSSEVRAEAWPPPRRSEFATTPGMMSGCLRWCRGLVRLVVGRVRSRGGKGRRFMAASWLLLSRLLPSGLVPTSPSLILVRWAELGIMSGDGLGLTGGGTLLCLKPLGNVWCVEKSADVVGLVLVVWPSPLSPPPRMPWLRSMVLKPEPPPRLCLFPLIFGRTVTPALSILRGLCSAGSGSLGGGESGSTRHPRESGSSPGRSTRELYTSLASSDMLDCVGANKRQVH